MGLPLLASIPPAFAALSFPHPASSVLLSVHKVWGGGHPQGTDHRRSEGKDLKNPEGH